jgi:hypothetical protein
MGAALLTFMPGKMSFEDYFCWRGLTEDEQAVRFLVGLSPTLVQRTYLADEDSVDFGKRRGPSTAIACQLCAGMAATQAVKILLGRGTVLAAPHGLHFDAYRGSLRKTWRPWGNRNPLQRIAIAIVNRRLHRAKDSDVGAQMTR